LRSYGGLKLQDAEKIYGKIFKNFVPKVFIASPIDVLRSNFVKSGGREVGKVVRYLPDKNNKISPYSPDLAQNLPRPAPDNVRRALQISPKSVHFRRSYIRTGEHC